MGQCDVCRDRKGTSRLGSIPFFVLVALSLSLACAPAHAQATYREWKVNAPNFDDWQKSPAAAADVYAQWYCANQGAPAQYSTCTPDYVVVAALSGWPTYVTRLKLTRATDGGTMYTSQAQIIARNDLEQPADDKQLGCDGKCPAAGDGLASNPINTGTGNKVQLETDYGNGGAQNLSFARVYNSKAVVTSALGPKWRHTYERSIQFREVAQNTQIARVIRADGRILTFSRTASGWQSDPDVVSKLSWTASGLGSPLSWTYIDENDTTETFDRNGRLISIAFRSGYSQTLSYGTRGLSAVIDSYGRQLQFGYDSQNRINALTVPGSGIFQYAYSTTGMLSSVTYPDNTSRQYVYNEPSHTAGANLVTALTGIVDESGGRFATYQYNATGAATSTAHAGGADQLTVTYNANGTATLIGASGRIRTYAFSTIHGMRKISAITGVTDLSSGEFSSLGYDSAGNVASRTDSNGIQTTFVFDIPRNLQTSRTEAAGTRSARTIATQWHPTYRVPAQIDEAGRRTSYIYDASGNVLTRTLTDLTEVPSASRTWTYTYNSFGKVYTEDGPRTDVSDVTTYTHYNCTTGYECGQVHTITNAAGHVTIYNSYNAHGQPLTITDANGVVSMLTYDLRQRLKSRTVGSDVTTIDYWPTGLLKKATLPDGSYLEYTYDAAHRLTDINDADGNRIHYTLDLMGNRTKEESYDPSNDLARKRIRVFDTLNRLQKDIGAADTAAVTTTFGYDNNGNQTSIAAPLGRDSIQAYDELNRLKQVTDPLNGNTYYGYNALDQLISVTDPRSKVTSYTYNALGNLTQQVSPDTGTTTNTYDAAGNLLTSTDARNKTATYGYDALNRVTSVTYSDQTIGYTYDTGTNQKGRLTQVTDGSGSTSWTYDDQGRVLSRQQNMGITKSVGYAYDISGRLQTLTLPSGNTIGYGYSNGKVTSLTLNGSTTILSNVLYQPFGPTQGWTWGNATLAVREYDTDGLVTDIDSAGLKTYDYDDAFRITDIIDASDSALSQNYGYDLLDRLTSATGTSVNQGWTYDANGNRLTQTGDQPSTYAVSGTSNRLSSVSGALTRSYTYNASGSVTSDGSATFTYDDAGRLVSATKAGVTTTYALNALGQRVRKTSAGASTYFVYDEAGHLVGEYDNTGALIQETVWFGDIPVATLRPNGASVDVFYVHADHLNTPRRISRPSDNVIVWRRDSDPFGTSAANQDPDGDAQAFVYGLRFPGQYVDAETELFYNYFRDYDPATGRYVQSDPIGLKGGINTYAYVKSNPLSRIDPFGLDSRAEPQPCIGCWPFPPPTTRPPGGWWEEEFAKDVWDGAKNIGRRIKDWCTSDDDVEVCKKQCDDAYEVQRQICNMLPTITARRRCWENAMEIHSGCLARCGRGESPAPPEED